MPAESASVPSPFTPPMRGREESASLCEPEAAGAEEAGAESCPAAARGCAANRTKADTSPTVTMPTIHRKTFSPVPIFFGGGGPYGEP